MLLCVQMLHTGTTCMHALLSGSACAVQLRTTTCHWLTLAHTSAPPRPLASVQWDGSAVSCSVTIMTGLQAAQACMQWHTTRWSSSVGAMLAATHNIVTWHAVDEQPVYQVAVAADVVTTEDALLSFAVKTAIFALFAFLRQHWTVCYGVWA